MSRTRMTLLLVYRHTLLKIKKWQVNLSIILHLHELNSYRSNFVVLCKKRKIKEFKIMHPFGAKFKLCKRSQNVKKKLCKLCKINKKNL